jgi:hypothetical protein
MSFSEVLQQILFEGRIALVEPIGADHADEREAVLLLERAFHDHRLTVAGPPLAFDRQSALRAARLVVESAWVLVSHANMDDDVERRLRLPDPSTPSQHLSADLLLRYVPQLYRRARGLNPADPLLHRLIDVLRRWPLSGVLADLTEGPLTDLEFGAHPGLLMLYAERLADHFKPAWVPRGRGWPYLELVWTELGKDVALLH